HRGVRLGACLVLAAALVAGAVFWFEDNPFQHETMFGALLLLGIPPFYLLTFAGMAEETEVEIGAMCAALGLGLWMLRSHFAPNLQSLGFAIPLAIYLVYTMRILPALRVFKHVVRGLSFARVGRYRWALASLRRALQL